MNTPKINEILGSLGMYSNVYTLADSKEVPVPRRSVKKTLTKASNAWFNTHGDLIIEL